MRSISSSGGYGAEEERSSEEASEVFLSVSELVGTNRPLKKKKRKGKNERSLRTGNVRRF